MFVLRCRVVMEVSLPMVHTILFGTAFRTCCNGFDGFHRRDLKDHVERWTLAAHDDDHIVPHSVEERCSSLETNLAPLRVIVGSLGRHLAHLMYDEYKHLNTVREHGGFRKAILEGLPRVRQGGRCFRVVGASARRQRCLPSF